MDSQVLFWIIATYFLWWAAHLLLERLGGMAPQIWSARDVARFDQQRAASQRRQGRAGTPQALRRTTRALDAEGRYRIRTRPAPVYAKGLWALSLAGVALWQLFKPGGLAEYLELFWWRKPDAIGLTSCKLAASMVLSWYLFEIPLLQQYHRLDISSLVHHWLSIFAAVAVLAGIFLPYAIWYGVVLIGFTFPLFFAMGFRLHLGPRYPRLARRLCGLASGYYGGLLLVGVPGAILIIARGLQTGATGAGTAAVLALSVCAWLYDDLRLIRFLRTASTFRYEDLPPRAREQRGCEPVPTLARG